MFDSNYNLFVWNHSKQMTTNLLSQTLLKILMKKRSPRAKSSPCQTLIASASPFTFARCFRARGTLILLLRGVVFEFFVFEGFHAFNDAVDGHGEHALFGEFADDFGGGKVIPAVLGIGSMLLIFSFSIIS